MIFLSILSGIVLVSVAYILFAPVYIEIDSIHSIYQVRLHKILSVSFFVNGEASLLEVKAGLWKRRIDLSKAPATKTHAAEEKKQELPASFPFRKLLAVIRSFKVTRLDASLDLGDMSWNGMLYPCFCWLSFITGKNIQINFEGRNSLVLHIENNIARMSRAFLCS